jgi:hypothetical protein
MFKFIIKWVFRLVLAAFALLIITVIVLLLTYNTILKDIMERNIRAQTGMEAEIGRLHVYLTEPMIEIQDLQLYNTADFGGAPFLNIPEIHLEYDLSALMKGDLHITLMRLKFAELDIVKNQSGQMNIFALAGQTSPGESAPIVSTPHRVGPVTSPASPVTMPQVPQPGTAGAPSTHAAAMPAINFQQQTGYTFSGIDKLNVSFEKEKFIDLKDPSNDIEQTVGLDNCIVPHVKSTTDLLGLVVLIDLRSGQFFQHVTGANGRDPLNGLLRSLGAQQ